MRVRKRDQRDQRRDPRGEAPEATKPLYNCWGGCCPSHYYTVVYLRSICLQLFFHSLYTRCVSSSTFLSASPLWRWPLRPPQPTGGILSDLPTIIDGVKDLLSEDTIKDLQTIVKGGAVLLGGDTPKNLQNLLSTQNIDKLQDIVDNAHTLLTPNFVNETSGLIGDTAPV